MAPENLHRNLRGKPRPIPSVPGCITERGSQSECSSCSASDIPPSHGQIDTEATLALKASNAKSKHRSKVRPEKACKSYLRRDTNRWIRRGESSLLGLLVTGLLFMALPLFQQISAFIHKKSEVVLTNLSIAPPPAPPEAKPPPIEKEEEVDQPKLRTRRPKLTLSQLELALNPGMGDATVDGDFSFDFSVNSMDELEMTFDIGEVDRIPKPTFMASPIYPPDLKRRGTTGVVTLLFVCTSKGRVRHIRIKSSTYAAFDESARDALSKWRFRPGMKGGKPVNVRMLIPFQYGDPQ